MAAHAAEAIRVVTEELPPYNMMKDGKVTGLGTEVVRAVMQRAGVSAVIELMPWARAYDTALTTRNVLIYSIARSPPREKLFKWVGEVTPPERNFLFALASRHLTLGTLDEARAYRIATVNGDFSEEYLLAHGFNVTTNLSRSNKVDANYAKLKVGRVDLWLAGELSALYITRNAGDPDGTLEKVLMIPNVAGDDDGAAMAFGPNTPDALVQRFRDALVAIQRDGTYQAIQKRWR